MTIVLAAVGLLTLTWWVAFLALVGRSTFPARERLPLRSWRPDDVRRNAHRGATQLSTAEARAHRIGTR